MRTLPPLSALRAFEAAARLLSFKLAADELNVTPTAISHQIRLLEDWMEVKLFERQTRQVRLTASGHRLFPAIRDGLDGMAERVQSVRRSRMANIATLTSTVAFMAKRLAPHTGAFRHAYPDWILRLDASNTLVSLEGEADAAIRYGRGQYPGLIAEPLFYDCFAPVCSPHLNVSCLNDLKTATLVHFEWGEGVRGNEYAPVWRRWLERVGLGDIDPDSGVSFTDEIHAIQATIAGQGVGLLSLTLVAEELASGALIQPFPVTLESYQYDFVYSARSANQPAVEVLRKWVKSIFHDAKQHK